MLSSNLREGGKGYTNKYLSSTQTGRHALSDVRTQELGSGL